MRIGRFALNYIKDNYAYIKTHAPENNSIFGYTKCVCGCVFLDLWNFCITWNHKNCKCSFCRSFDCICKDDESECM